MQPTFRSLAAVASATLMLAGLACADSRAAPQPGAAAIEIIAIGAASTDAEDANGNPEDGCTLNFEIRNRSGINLKTFSASFDVMRASNGEPLKAHFKIALSDIGVGAQQVTPPDLIHAVKCPDLKVLMKGRICIDEQIVECPALALSTRGIALIELRTRK